MSTKKVNRAGADLLPPPPPALRKARSDGQRNVTALLEAAKEVFAESGVDAPVRDIAARAGVGIGTVYRHFPRRPDLIAEVFRHDLDACAKEADALSTRLPPFEALASWMQHFVTLAGTKHGLAKTVDASDPAYAALPARRDERLTPACRRLFDRALAAGEIRNDVSADEFLRAAASLCQSAKDSPPTVAARLVALLVDGLRQGAGPSAQGIEPR